MLKRLAILVHRYLSLQSCVLSCGQVLGIPQHNGVTAGKVSRYDAQCYYPSLKDGK